MPILQSKVTPREVLKYHLELTMIDAAEDETTEFEVQVVVRPDKVEHRLENREGMGRLPESLLGQSEHQPPFLPWFPDVAVEIGQSWTGPDGTTLELTSIQGDQAELLCQKKALEFVCEFDIPRGKMVAVHSSGELTSQGRKVRLLGEYSLL